MSFDSSMLSPQTERVLNDLEAHSRSSHLPGHLGRSIECGQKANAEFSFGKDYRNLNHGTVFWFLLAALPKVMSQHIYIGANSSQAHLAHTRRQSGASSASIKVSSSNSQTHSSDTTTQNFLMSVEKQSQAISTRLSRAASLFLTLLRASTPSSETSSTNPKTS